MEHITALPYFPIWWYVVNLKNFWLKIFPRTLILLWDAFGLSVVLRHFFAPYRQDRTFVGYLIGISLRLIWTLASLIFLAGAGVLLLAGWICYLVWPLTFVFALWELLEGYPMATLIWLALFFPAAFWYWQSHIKALAREQQFNRQVENLAWQRLSLDQNQANLAKIENRWEEFLQEKGLTLDEIDEAQNWVRAMETAKSSWQYWRDEFWHRRPGVNLGWVAGFTPTLKHFSTDITRLINEGRVPYIVGREHEIGEVIDILSRTIQNNVLLLGPAGVGKTSIVFAIAERIFGLGRKGQGEKRFNAIKGKRVIQLNLAAMLAGTSRRGELEERLVGTLRDVQAGQVILFIDEIDTLVESGILSVLTPALARGDYQVIGTVTPQNFRSRLENLAEFSQQFEKVLVGEPSRSDAIRILEGFTSRIEKKQKVKISFQAIEAAVDLTRRFVHDQVLPEKALDLLDETATAVATRGSGITKPSVTLSSKTPSASLSFDQSQSNAAARARPATQSSTILDDNKAAGLPARQRPEPQALAGGRNACPPIAYAQGVGRRVSPKGILGFDRFNRKDLVTAEDVAQVLSSKLGIPLTTLTEEEAERLLRLEDAMHRQIIDQEEAIAAISNAMRRARSGLAEKNRPLAAFLFVGPTGVGKTLTAKTLAEVYFGEAQKEVRFDMSEFSEHGSVVSFTDRLVQAVRERPFALILLDEFEKAEPDIHNLFLQIIDEGRLTDSQGSLGDFSQTIIIATSNAYQGGEVGDSGALGSLDSKPKPRYTSGQGAVKRPLTESFGAANGVEWNLRSQGSPSSSLSFGGERQDFRSQGHPSSPGEELGDGNRSATALGGVSAHKSPFVAANGTLVRRALEEFFRPELLNRFDDIIVFNRLNWEQLKQVTRLEIKKLAQRLEEQQIKLEVSEKVVEDITKMGYDEEYGARPLQRVIQQELEDKIAKMLLEGKLKKGDRVSF